MAYDVAIIGAGIVGAALADRLTSEGYSVAIFGNGSAHSATDAGMGHIVVMDDSEAQFALTSYSQCLWNELAEELPPEAEFENCGTLWIASDDEELAEARRKLEYYRKRGIEAEILDEQSLKETEPGLRDGLAGALLVPGDSVVYQPFVSRFLFERAVLNGAVDMGPDWADIVEDGVVEGFLLLDRIEADRTIVAAGCFSREVLPLLDVKPRKGHLVITDRGPQTVNHQLVELGYLNSAHGSDEDSVAFNIQPRRTGQLLIGSSRQYAGKDDSVDLETVGKMMRRAIDYFPSAADARVTRIWTGFRPATPDGLPYIGRVPGHNNVYSATGHEGLGITTALGTAALIADEIAGRESAIPRDPYSPARLDG